MAIHACSVIVFKFQSWMCDNSARNNTFWSGKKHLIVFIALYQTQKRFLAIWIMTPLGIPINKMANKRIMEATISHITEILENVSYKLKVKNIKKARFLIFLY